jgi:hypothetical protein
MMIFIPSTMCGDNRTILETLIKRTVLPLVLPRQGQEADGQAKELAE